MIDEVDRIIAASKCLLERGAYKIYVIATHGIFSDNACELLAESPITEVCILITAPLYSITLIEGTPSNYSITLIEGAPSNYSITLNRKNTL